MKIYINNMSDYQLIMFISCKKTAVVCSRSLFYKKIIKY